MLLKVRNVGFELHFDKKKDVLLFAKEREFCSAL